jgi:hypothetical protein
VTLAGVGRTRPGAFRKIALPPWAFYDPLHQCGEIPLAREQRKLAAILAGDVVGYSRLMGRDDGEDEKFQLANCLLAPCWARGGAFLLLALGVERGDDAVGHVGVGELSDLAALVAVDKSVTQPSGGCADLRRLSVKPCQVMGGQSPGFALAE